MSNSEDEKVYTVKYMITRLEAKLDKVIDDHEIRLRSLEADKSQRRGALTLVTSLIAVIAAAAALVAVFVH